MRTRIGQLRRGASLGVVAVAYVTAVGVGLVAATAVDGPAVGLGACYLGSALVIYCWSLAVDNGSMFDAWWSVLPVVGAVWLTVTADGDPGLRQWLVLAVVILWGVRLTANWATAWPGLGHEDWRYLDMYEKGPKPLISLFGVHLVPAATVYLGSLPLVTAIHDGDGSVGPLAWIAFVVGLGAVAIEGVADLQLRAFNRTKQPGQIVDGGLWRLSRHPNYFGEVTFWWSLWLAGLAADAGSWWTVVGALAITAMIRGASIPMMDRRSTERRPGFADYAARTPALVPRPRR
ncbi:MAG: DUF1295 domain-containing protein, partial [Actinomycetota bacterium]